MNRLVQGDVGSGKTVVALLALANCVLNGYQGALMAPTEILAEQHYISLSETLKPFGMEIELLVGSLTKKQKEKVLERVKNKEIDILIGTHALIEDKVEFNNLDASRPASISRPIHKILRKELKFKGVIITDDMGMGALTSFAQKQNTNIDVMAIEAGNDILLSNSYVDGIPAIKDAIKHGDISQKQIDNSVKRILKLKDKLNILK